MNVRRFRELLMQWNGLENQRTMPWKGISDPYRIWLSEIILQQTRVEQGTAYYQRFVDRYPTVAHLAAAPEQEVMKLWEGLGYYSRCRNLHHTAREIVSRYEGRFPPSYEALLKLKGVGPYTAAAIASFAFNRPHAVLDGNVYRILARVFGIHEPVNSAPARQLFSTLAARLLDPAEPAAYNQAIMDFGATVCKPVPACEQCPLQPICHAFKKDLVRALPVKLPKPARRPRYLHYLVLRSGQRLWLQQRRARDIWKDLFEFYAVETPAAGKLSRRTLNKTLAEQGITAARLQGEAGPYVQQLTHQTVEARFYVIETDAQAPLHAHGQWVNLNRLHAYPLPRLLNRFCAENPFR